MSILRSRLKGGAEGIHFDDMPHMTIEHSVVAGPAGSLVFTISEDPQTPHLVTVDTSVLAGAVNRSADGSTADPLCTNVYNEHNVLLKADCSTNSAP